LTKKEFKYLVNIITLLAVVLVYFGIRCLPCRQACLPRQKAASPQTGSLVYVTKAIDGDTIKLATGEHVRLIGIDTPESRYNSKVERDSARSRKDIKAILKMGKEASLFTRQLTEGKKVKLEFDAQKRDRYGRLLAYVYLEDGTFVNARVIEEGYAQVMTIPPNVKYADMFLRSQVEARKNGRGLWKGSTGKELF